MNSNESVLIGVGIDTARYGHHAAFLRADLQPAAQELRFAESPAGYAEFRQALERIHNCNSNIHFCIRIDAAGQYAVNLEQFVRSLPFDKTITIGQPKQNKDYCSVHFPKRKADSVEAQACARFAVVEQPRPTPQTPPAFNQLRDVCAALEGQVKQTTRLVNQLHNRLSRVFPELALEATELNAQWVLRLLAKYPTPAKIAGARMASLLSIPYMTEDKAERIQAAALHTVASATGSVAEGLIRESVRSIDQSQEITGEWKSLLQEAYDALPPGPHLQIETIPGIGKQTAAALVAKMIDIDRFATPNSLVNYFGVFPEENTSGVDKKGKPLPPGTMQMSRKGNDLVRRCLWNAAKSAIVHNPTIRSLYARQRARGKRGDVALGLCMQKLLHLVFALWKTNKPYVAPAAPVGEEPTMSPETENAEGRKGQSPERQAVTSAPSIILSSPPAGKVSGPVPASASRKLRVNFAELRGQITIEQVLRELQWGDHMAGHGCQRRGPCPIHDASTSRSRSFSVDVNKHIFQCFNPSCGAKGNALDLWAQSQHLPIAQAAEDLAQRLKINPEQRRGTSPAIPAKGGTTHGQRPRVRASSHPTP